MNTTVADESKVKTNASILVLDDDRFILDSINEYLSEEGHRVQTASDFDHARRILERGGVQIVVTDLNMPDHNGLEVIRYVHERYPTVVVIVITAYGSINSAVEAIKLGAYDYLTKPVVDEELSFAIERALKQQALQAENIALKQQLRRQVQFGALVGRDRQMQKVFEMIETVASTTTTILITGESGTGKSMVARAIHQHSDRRELPFVEVSCGALPENLLESELFGHVRGSFTGAIADKQGRFLAANGGTIFLDEIDSATPALQVKLLRVLQERQFEPVGSNKTVTVDVRVIVATNKDLKQRVEKEQFRQDLYYRINVVQINLSPLRERLSDICLLADHFLAKFNDLHHKTIDHLAPETIHVLERYRWPGNVRELENMIERAVVLARSRIIMPDDLPSETVRDSAAMCSTGSGPETSTFSDALLQAEREIICRTLERCNGSRKLTAERLGISRTSLFRKIRHFRLPNQP